MAMEVRVLQFDNDCFIVYKNNQRLYNDFVNDCAKQFSLTGMRIRGKLTE
ncbi:unnamed protein product [Lupinus luteus]|uniref:Uncharacterized protein n=1 Tax=Lupinus luteus TaxID=3873 RepID=A0AAV1VZR5_LUPLU